MRNGQLWLVRVRKKHAVGGKRGKKTQTHKTRESTTKESGKRRTHRHGQETRECGTRLIRIEPTRLAVAATLLPLAAAKAPILVPAAPTSAGVAVAVAHAAVATEVATEVATRRTDVAARGTIELAVLLALLPTAEMTAEAAVAPLEAVLIAAVLTTRPDSTASVRENKSSKKKLC